MRPLLQVGLAVLTIGTLVGCGAKPDFSQTDEGKKVSEDFYNFPLKLSDGKATDLSTLVGIASPSQEVVTKNSDGTYGIAVHTKGFPHYIMSADEQTVTPADKAAQTPWGAQAVNRGEELGGSNGSGSAASSSQSSSGTGSVSGSDSTGTQAAAAPSVRVFGQNYAPITQNGLTVQVNRIEVSDNTTTLYLQATNQSGSQITFSDNTATLIQDGTQLGRSNESKWFPIGIANGVTVNAELVYDGALNVQGGPATFSMIVGGAYGAVGYDAFQPYAFNLQHQQAALKGG